MFSRYTIYFRLQCFWGHHLIRASLNWLSSRLYVNKNMVIPLCRGDSIIWTSRMLSFCGLSPFGNKSGGKLPLMPSCYGYCLSLNEVSQNFTSIVSSCGRKKKPVRFTMKVWVIRFWEVCSKHLLSLEYILMNTNQSEISIGLFLLKPDLICSLFGL